MAGLTYERLAAPGGAEVVTGVPQPKGKLVEDLSRLGVVSGDLLMVHASMRAIGSVEGGAAGLVSALEAAVGPGGSLLMTLGAVEDAVTPFDHLRTPADPDVGVLAEVFRALPGTVVSNHPEGRFGARGHLAEKLMRDVPWNDYYGAGSPLERLVQAGGKVLRLGADIDTVTLLHYAEFLAPVPDKRRVRRNPLVLGENGPERLSVDTLDDSDGIVDYPGEDYFGIVLRAYLASGRAKEALVGQAKSELIDAADLVEFAVAWMTANLTP